MALVGAGATNRDVAARLVLSPHTVSTHLRHAFVKLDINSRVELARIVAQRELHVVIVAVIRMTASPRMNPGDQGAGRTADDRG